MLTLIASARRQENLHPPLTETTVQPASVHTGYNEESDGLYRRHLLPSLQDVQISFHSNGQCVAPVERRVHRIRSTASHQIDLNVKFVYEGEKHDTLEEDVAVNESVGPVDTTEGPANEEQQGTMREHGDDCILRRLYRCRT